MNTCIYNIGGGSCSGGGGVGVGAGGCCDNADLPVVFNCLRHLLKCCWLGFATQELPEGVRY